MPRIYKPRGVTPKEWFWVRVPDRPRHPAACWLWTGPPVGRRREYGQFFVSPGVKVYAHRFAYELLAGPVPDGLTLDHVCRNTLCVRPSHLEPVTLQENIRRAVAARKAA